MPLQQFSHTFLKMTGISFHWPFKFEFGCYIPAPMTTHSETRTLPYSADQMYALIADIESYPQFLPWCVGCRIRSRRNVAVGEVVDADMIVSFKVFREKFGSRVTLTPQQRKIDVEYLDGPFKYLINNWSFAPIDDQSCEVSFFVDFEFKSIVLQKLIGLVFHEAMQRVVRAFEARAVSLYGGGPPPA